MKENEPNIELAEKLVELRIATRSATMCENVSGKNKNTLSLKTKILFLLKNDSLPPIDIMTTLHLAKTNLALLTGEMEREGLITKDKQLRDKRLVYYSITDKGKEYLNARLDIIESALKKAFHGDEYDKAFKALSEAVAVLSFL